MGQNTVQEGTQGKVHVFLIQQILIRIMIHCAINEDGYILCIIKNGLFKNFYLPTGPVVVGLWLDKDICFEDCVELDVFPPFSFCTGVC